MFTMPSGMFVPRGAAGPTDPLFAYVKSLLHFDDGNNSTAFTDVISGQSWIASGSGTVESTAQAAFGSGSLFVGGGYITSTAVALGAGRICIEGSFYLTSSASRGLFTNRISSDALGIQLGFDGAGNLGLFINGATPSAPCSPTLNAWHTYCVERDLSNPGGNNNVRVYIDGVVLFTTTIASGFDFGTSAFYHGAYYSGSFPTFGYIDECRITTGQPVDRYAGNYTPATAAFPNS